MPRRKSIRLKNYDYSLPGYYFITICAQNHAKIFGNIITAVGADDSVCPNTADPEPHMLANDIGRIVEKCWYKINNLYENVKTDAFCLMPNHIHGIIVISEGGQGRPPLHKIIQGYKSVSTRMCYKYNYRNIWQRNYYDRIIRNEEEYSKIQEYIINNPLKWHEDKYYI